jgi:hypothetical protein
MAIEKQLSIAIENQFPEFVKTDGPNLIAFAKAYFEYLEQSGNALETNRNLLDYQDLDNTLTTYLQYFQRELMADIPENMLTDKRLLLKRIKDLYTSKGSQKSYDLLFRILYNQDIDFYYPGEDILRASDGRWVKDSILNVIIINGQATDFTSQKVTGSTSGATATVENVVTTISSGLEVTELNITSVVGTFIDGETVTIESGSSAEVFNTIGPLSDVTITRGGKGHVVGDSVTFSSATGQGAQGTVAEVSDTSSFEVFVQNGGSGYQVNAAITISGGSGTGGAASIASLTNTEIILLNTDRILPMKNVVLNTGPKFVSLGANTTSVSANLALANVSTTLIAGLNFQNTTVGSISSVTTTDFGFGYDGVANTNNLPTATVIDFQVSNLNIKDPGEFPPDFKGRDALLGTRNVSGAISDVTVGAETIGTGYRKFDQATITNSRSGSFNARGTPVITGVIDQPGRYTDTKGFLSGNNKLQDNFYYQEYSYVIQSQKFIDTYREVVNSVLHPAGVKLFGEFDHDSSMTVTPSSADANRTFANTIHSFIESETASGALNDFSQTGDGFDTTGITFDTI